MRTYPGVTRDALRTYELAEEHAAEREACPECGGSLRFAGDGCRGHCAACQIAADKAAGWCE